MQFRFAALLYCAAALTPLVATAQQRTNGPGPTDSSAIVPAVKYQSTFTGYVPFRDEKLAPWREVNYEAARVGGHIGIFGGSAHAGHGAAKPATQPSLPASSSPASDAPQTMHQGRHEGIKK